MNNKEINKRRREVALERLEVLKHNLRQAKYDPDSIFHEISQELDIE